MADFTVAVSLSVKLHWIKPAESLEERMYRERAQAKIDHAASVLAEQMRERAQEDPTTILLKLIDNAEAVSR